jgi:hypothetical protein
MAGTLAGERDIVRAMARAKLLVVASLLELVTSDCIGVSQKRGVAGSVGGTGADIKTCHTGTRVADDGLIDDFEDGNNQVSAEAGRDGYWWPKKDPVGSTIEPTPFAPSDGAGDGSETALHASGKTVSGEGAWGAGFGANLVQNAAYDASKYAGISFRAKVAPGSTTGVRFNIEDVNTHPDGKICKTCWNAFGKDMILTTEWKEYRIPFSEAHQQPDWGNPRPIALSPSKLIEVDWQIGPGQTYDIWIDDLAFVDCK